MDAGIIAAFKHRYHRFLLQHAIDCDEARESDIYKVDQLKAMQ
ncbi:31501_t:CDS:1, partial [Racocetra persica]